MSQSDPKSKKPEASTPAPQQPATTPKPSEKAKTAAPAGKPSSGGWILALVVIAVVAAGVSALILRSPKSSPPVASASEEMEATDMEASSEDASMDEAETEEEPAEEVVEAAKAPSAPTTGTLVVRSDVEGADVFLNGKRVGKTPHQAKGLAPGSYEVRVEKDGYQPYREKLQLAAKRQELSAKLTPASASLKVASNVAGATVLIDGEERGTTPLELSDLPPGRHELTISASGYRAHTETIELKGGLREVSVDLVSPAADLNEAVAVKHKHRLGSCEGVLRATASGIVYESDKHAFTAELTGVSEISLDGDELKLKIDGKTYNFNERNDNNDALGGFYERVKDAVRLGQEGS